jgi:hypothetical protein
MGELTCFAGRSTKELIFEPDLETNVMNQHGNGKRRNSEQKE